MKKSLLFLAPFLILPLASCGSNEGKTLKELKKESVISKELIEENYPLSEALVKYETTFKIGDGILTNHNYVERSDKSCFFIVQDKTSSELYLYLTYENKFATKLAGPTIQGQLFDSIFGEFVVVKNADNVNVLLDMFGNVLYSSTNAISNLSSTNVEEGILRINFSDGSANKFIIYNVTSEEYKTYNVDDVIPANFSYQSLELFGYKEYKVAFVDYKAIILKDGNSFLTFDIPLAKPSYVIGKNFFFVKETKLPDDASKYDVIDSGIKYSVEIQKIDFTTGKKDILSLPGYSFRSSSIQPFKDKNGIYSYIKADVIPLTKDKVADTLNARTYVIDADLNLRDDLTDVGNMYYVDFNNKSYIVEDKKFKVFDNKFNTIGSYEEYAKHFYPEAKVFVGQQDGKCGIFNLEGKVLVPFKFDSIDQVFSSGYAYGMIDEKQEKISFDLNSGAKFEEVEYKYKNYACATVYNVFINEISDDKSVELYNTISGETKFQIDDVSNASVEDTINVYKSHRSYSLLEVKNVEDGSFDYYAIQQILTEKFFLEIL